MFTGLVEEVGRVVSLEPSATGIRFTVKAPLCAADTHKGDSIAVNGCCLTVVDAPESDLLRFDLLAETVRRTNFQQLRSNGVVNLERSLPPTGRMGGHFVSGHVDGTVTITRWEPCGADWVLEVALPPEGAKYVVHKGCIALDGISLTISDLLPEGRVRAYIIPHTYQATALSERQCGDLLNVEFDLLAKYVETILANRSNSFA
jgi:riboflavin synthase